MKKVLLQIYYFRPIMCIVVRLTRLIQRLIIIALCNNDDDRFGYSMDKLYDRVEKLKVPVPCSGNLANIGITCTLAKIWPVFNL